MQKISTLIATILLSAGLWAVPAYRGWHTKTQLDGKTIEVRLVGDEFYSYWETKDGQMVLEQKDGKFVKSPEPLPSPEEIRARRAKGMNNRMRKTIGKKNLAPKGVVILVNFSDSVMKQEHDSLLFDNMCNAKEGECTTNIYENVQYGSAAQFFADQSNGSYRPHFDVFGPVTLPHPVKYYGEAGYHKTLKRDESDLYLADFVIDAVLTADAAGCDFSQYDSDNDGTVDFVYLLYAGQGQAAGGESWTIWPHNSNLESILYYNYTHGREDYYCDEQRGRKLPVIDGKEINNYACSSELDSNKELCGIGTLCHEFGHVMGLPDYYDTKYSVNSNSHLIPNTWDIMDYGSYNGEGHCPPNYNPWSKYFFGWIDPINPGQESTSCTLNPNGTADYNAYQINKSGEKQAAWTEALNYYVEYRQKTGWDTFTPAAGMIIWRCDFDSTAWKSNTPNNTAGEPRLTLECSSGVMVGSYNPTGNVFPNGTINSWTDDAGNHLTNITQNEDNVTFHFDYDDTPIEPLWTEWAYYDDGEPLICKGKSDSTLFYWGIKFPANTLAHDTLTKVSIFESPKLNTKPITIYVFSGGVIPIPENMIYVDSVNPSGVEGFHEVTLAKPVPFDTQKTLWLMLSEEGDHQPAIGSANNGTHNTSWISVNGLQWYEVTESKGTPYSWMLRAYIGPDSEHKGIDNIKVDSNVVKILQNGQLFIIRGDMIFSILGQKIN